MAARRHMHEFGTTPEQLAEIAVGVREYAGLNPSAQYRDPITVEDVLSSRMIADPLHKLDCCVISDGGGAFIMTTRERARDLPRPPVFVLGAAGAQTHWTISQMPDFTTTAAARCGPEAFGRAGVRPEDIDTIQCYDSFTITVLLLLEDMGFCAKGEGGAFVRVRRPPTGGTPSAQHRRRWAVGLPPGHAWDLPDQRGGPPAPGRGRRGPGSRRRVGRGLRIGWLAVLHRHRRARKGGPVVSIEELAATVRLRALPHPDHASRHYWQSAAEGRLVVQRCTDCGEFQFYPRCAVRLRAQARPSGSTPRVGARCTPTRSSGRTDRRRSPRSRPTPSESSSSTRASG